MGTRRKATAAQMRATANWEAKNYYKVLVRFKAADEDAIRKAAGDSVNGFIVRSVLRAVEESGRLQTTEPGGSEAPKGGSMESNLGEAPESRTGEAPEDRAAGDVVFTIDAETAEELRGAGIEPGEMLTECIQNRLDEIRAGIY